MNRVKLSILPVFVFLFAAPGSPGLAESPGTKPPLIQIALLLDTSSSMSGLINQAKSQLWKVVNEFAYARKAGAAPELQVALYEYGNNTLPAAASFLRRVLPLTLDL